LDIVEEEENPGPLELEFALRSLRVMVDWGSRNKTFGWIWRKLGPLAEWWIKQNYDKPDKKPLVNQLVQCAKDYARAKGWVEE
jgi:hypothetical protein